MLKDEIKKIVNFFVKPKKVAIKNKGEWNC